MKIKPNLIQLRNCSLIILMLLMVSSCATVHTGTVDLSLKLEQQLYALKTANEDIINLLYDSKEEMAIQHVDNEWYPKYLNNFFNLSPIQNEWSEIIEEENLKERVSKIGMIAKVTSIAYNQYKNELFDKINSDRQNHLKQINEAYDLAIRINATIMRNISSVKKLEQGYQKYLPTANFEKEMENIRSVAAEGIDKYIDKADSALDVYKKNEDKIDSVINKLKK